MKLLSFAVSKFRTGPQLSWRLHCRGSSGLRRTADRHHRHLLTCVLAGVVALPAAAAPPDDLLGRWQIDLRPSPEAPRYLQTFEVTSVENTSITGTFYNSPIRNGRLNADWPDVHLAFTTSDGSGEYHTSAVLRDGRLEGRTLAVGREFLMPWRAIRMFDDTILTPQEAQADFDLLSTAINEVHPGARRYASDESLDDRLTRLRARLSEPVSGLTFYEMMATLTASLRCGHSRVEPPADLDSFRNDNPTSLPFLFRLFDGVMYVDVAHPSADTLRRGDVITMIDGIAVDELVERLGRTVVLDGYTDEARSSRLQAPYEYADSGFEQFLPCITGLRGDHVLHVRRQGTDRADVVVVSSITRTEQRALAPAGARNFSDDDAVSLTPVDDTAMRLNVETFVNYRSPVDPVTRYRAVFEEARARGTDHLIIDLRRNGGGSSDAAWALARFLIDEPVAFRPPLVKSYRFDDALRPHISTWDPQVLNMPDEAFIPRDDGWFELRPEAAGRATSLDPVPDAYDGRVTILVGPYNASGSAMLVALLQRQDNITLVGEPTSGAIDGPTAGVLLTLKLPNSGLRVLVPLLRERTPGGPYPDGAGVTPDVIVRPTVTEWLEDRDVVLEAARDRRP